MWVYEDSQGQLIRFACSMQEEPDNLSILLVKCTIWSGTQKASIASADTDVFMSVFYHNTKQMYTKYRNKYIIQESYCWLMEKVRRAWYFLYIKL